MSSPSVPPKASQAPIAPPAASKVPIDDDWGSLLGGAGSPSAPAPSVPGPSVAPSVPAPAVSAPPPSVSSHGLPAPVLSEPDPPDPPAPSAVETVVVPALAARVGPPRSNPFAGVVPKRKHSASASSLPFFAPPTSQLPDEEPAAESTEAESTEAESTEAESTEAESTEAESAEAESEVDSAAPAQEASSGEAASKEAAPEEAASKDADEDDAVEVKAALPALEAQPAARKAETKPARADPVRVAGPVAASDEGGRGLLYGGLAAVAAVAIFVGVSMGGSEDPAIVVADESPAVALPEVKAQEEAKPVPVAARKPAEPEPEPLPELNEGETGEAEPSPEGDALEGEAAPSGELADEAQADEALPEVGDEEALPVADGDKVAQAEDLLVQARAALDEGRYRDATRLAKESRALRPSLASRKLIAIIACHRGDVAGARKVLKYLPPETAARVTKECLRKGIDVSDGPPPAKVEEVTPEADPEAAVKEEPPAKDPEAKPEPEAGADSEAG